MSFEERLIEEVRIRPFLYDLKDKRYKCGRLKESAWKEISEKLGKTESNCRTRWKNLRDHFRKLDRKLYSQSSVDNYYEIRWSYYNALLFLKNIATGSMDDTKLFSEDEKDFGLMLLGGTTVDDILPGKEECQSSATLCNNAAPEPYHNRRPATVGPTATPSQRYKQRKRKASENLPVAEGVSNFFTATQNRESPREKLYKGYAAKIDCANIPDLVKEQLDASINNLIFEKIKEYLTQ